MFLTILFLSQCYSDLTSLALMGTASFFAVAPVVSIFLIMPYAMTKKI